MFQCIQPKSSEIRALPYPFRGALSISSDVEFFDFRFFETFMKFLNTQKITPFGLGLGLEVTSSFFFYSANPYTFSYFFGTKPQATLSPVAERVQHYLQTGWIDTNHAYGDFNGVGGFSREHALECYNILTQLGVTLNVFTNHGCRENIQNVGPDAAYHCGDLRGHDAYHADLMKRNGVRYIWTDSMSISKKKSLRNFMMHLLKKKEPLLRDCVLQDGSYFKGFLRFRSTGTNAPNLSSFAYQIQHINWKKFYKNRNVLVLYQHLGVLYRNAGRCYQASVQAVSERPEVFLAPFYTLQQEYQGGRLWVCGLNRLLTYVDAIESVMVKYDDVRNCYDVLCDKAIEQPERFFQGLTIYVDTTRPNSVCYNGSELPIVYNGPDETGQYSVTVPIQKLKDIW
jgi:hypothetical protein